MGRIRTIKPELFLDEALGVLSGDHLALFVGLLTIADREGRLAWRPARVKVTLFPYRKVDVETLAAALDDAGKVQLYEVDGERYLWVCGFVRHQRPHPKEPASDLPPAPSREKKRPTVEGSSSIPSSPVGREGKGREKVREGILRAAPAAPRPGWQALIDEVVAIYQRVRGAKYVFGGHDAKALGMLWDAVGGDVERIKAMWERALRHVGFPTTASVPELWTNRNHFQGTAPTQTGQRRPTGAATAADTDWSGYTGPEVSGT